MLVTVRQNDIKPTYLILQVSCLESVQTYRRDFLMLSTLVSRRALVAGMAAVPVGLSGAGRAFGESGNAHRAAGEADGLSHSSESIHQEVNFKASRRQVYEALTSAQRFDALTRLSDAITLVTAPNAQATAISPAVGGSFTLFGGYITGCHLEMVSDERLVQAWRAASWNAGDYSVVKFVLVTEGAGCTIVFDHRGFPEGQGASLAYGWRVHYWEPLAKLLARG
jgi:activator of HSP90 ATPase